MRELIIICSFLLSTAIFAQQKEIKGNITDETGQFFPGVNIVVKNTTIKTLTDMDGNFKLVVPKDARFMTLSFVGYISQEIDITSASNFKIKLKPDMIMMDEVVVEVGYGKMIKSKIPGAVSTISTKDISEKTFSNFQQFLAGKAAGVVVGESSGQPGAALSVEIRGMSSISGSSQPLYVVDGIPFDAIGSSSGSTYAPATASSPLAGINPNDIASFEILKDASATSIYGSRGADGVILITTKQGKKGAPRINLSYNSSLSYVNFPIERLNAMDQALAVNEFNATRGMVVGYTPEEMKDLKYYDHFKEVSRTGIVNDFNASISGGSDVTKYYISYQGLGQQGVYKASDFNKNAIKVNIESQVKKNLRVSASLTYNRSVTEGFPINASFGSSLFSSALTYSPLVPMLNPDGSYNKLGNYKYGTTLYLDPVFGPIYYKSRFNLQTEVLSGITDEPANNTFVLIDKYKSADTSEQIIGNFNLTYNFDKHLSVMGKVGIISSQSLSESYRPRALPVELTWKGQASIRDNIARKLLYEARINYVNSFGKHSVDGVLAATAESYLTKIIGAESREFPNDVTGYYDIGAGSVLLPPSSSTEENRLASFLGRMNYGYANKYLVTLSGRYDGTSKFAQGNKFGFFPSIGVSWRVTKESFMKKVKILSDMKLRASYGIVGRQASGNYATLSTLSSGGMNYGFGSIVNPGYASSRAPNPDLSWEESKQINLGIDLAVLKNRISLSVDVYKKNTDKLLYNAQTPLTLGFSSQTQNVGAMENKGLEIALTTINFKKEFKWSTDFNIAFNKNKLTRLVGDVTFIQSGSEVGGLSRSYVGKPIAEIYAFRTLPVWNAESLATKPVTFQPGVKPGDVRFDDINNNGRLDDGDLLSFGSALPKYTGGIGNDLSYKNFDLNIFMSFSYGATAYNAFLARMSNVGGNNTAYKYFDTRYRALTPDMDAQTVEAVTQNNAVTHFPIAGTTVDSGRVKDFNVEKTSYLRINNITLGYNFPKDLVSKLNVQNIKVYFTVQNPWILTSYKGINPMGTSADSSIGRGIDSGGYPLNKLFSVGTNFTF
ncbi:SusC/RagA family TonB-linked outer membrane protein [Flavobacterium sp. FlaQc-48]|uniref:SusC/RagA family TonB-linked outer membrane protein n=1 Tax=Flavobacterium sp. FlaQc-48 TaxID=3374181 RepID=UPI003757ECBB